MLPLSTVVITTKEFPEPMFWSGGQEGAALCPELHEQCQFPACANYYNLRLFKKCRVSCELFEKRWSSRSLLAFLLKALGLNSYATWGKVDIERTPTPKLIVEKIVRSASSSVACVLGPQHS